MPPRNTDGSLDRGPSKRTSAQIKKRGTAKAASKRLMSQMKEGRRKNKKDKSMTDKLMGGIRGIGSDLAMGLGFKDKTDDYLSRTADTTAIRRAIERGDSSIEGRGDLQSRLVRQRMLQDMSDRRDKKRREERRATKTGTDTSTGTPTQTSEQNDMYAENLRRYNEYMKSQQPQGPAVTPEMRQAALQMFESQQGAGQMPYYMAAAAQSQDPNMSPAFQYAAQNYGTLGGSQRLAPRPMEMMSVAERRQINDMAQAMLEEETYTRQAQNQYQQGMDTVMRGSGKGGPATMPQQRMPQMVRPPQPMPQQSPFAAMLASRFGGMG